MRKLNFSILPNLMLALAVTFVGASPVMPQSALAADLAACQHASNLEECTDSAFERSLQRVQNLLDEIDKDLLEARGDLTPLFPFTDALAEELGQ
jgi:hypothetical protein